MIDPTLSLTVPSNLYTLAKKSLSSDIFTVHRRNLPRSISVMPGRTNRVASSSLLVMESQSLSQIRMILSLIFSLISIHLTGSMILLMDGSLSMSHLLRIIPRMLLLLLFSIVKTIVFNIFQIRCTGEGSSHWNNAQVC
jgi:hypothetical protein